MSDELRAAAKRVRRMRAAGLLTGPAFRALLMDVFEEERSDDAMDAYGQAEALLVDAYLAEHPSDDGEPVKPLTRERIERAAATRCRDLLSEPRASIDWENASVECVKDLAALARAYLAEHPADDGEPVKPLTRERIERAVEGLFDDGFPHEGKRRLLLVDDHVTGNRRQLGAWLPAEVVAHLCRELGVEP